MLFPTQDATAIRDVLTVVEEQLKQAIQDITNFISIHGVNEIVNVLKEVLQKLEDSTHPHETLIVKVEKMLADLHTHYTSVSNDLSTVPTKYAALNKYRALETTVQLMFSDMEMWKIRETVTNLSTEYVSITTVNNRGVDVN